MAQLALKDQEGKEAMNTLNGRFCLSHALGFDPLVRSSYDTAPVPERYIFSESYMRRAASKGRMAFCLYTETCELQWQHKPCSRKTSYLSPSRRYYNDEDASLSEIMETAPLISKLCCSASSTQPAPYSSNDTFRAYCAQSRAMVDQLTCHHRLLSLVPPG